MANNEAEGDGAVVLPRSADDPETLDDAVTKFGGGLKTCLATGEPLIKAVFANTGECFLMAEEDTVASHLLPLGQLGVGKWLDDKALADHVAKNGIFTRRIVHLIRLCAFW